jgi:phage shock protein PspC (stress-responsive transcriptional regulator)
MIAGVCGGIARYFGLDSTLVRIIAVGLTFVGGAGLLLYIAAMLLMPEEGSAATIAAGEGRGRAITVLGVVVLGLAAFAGIAVVGAVVGWILFPVAFLVVAGLFAWWIASGERPAGSAGDILKRSALGLALLAVCGAVAAGGAWAAAVGDGTVGAALVIGAGAVLVAAAFVRPARWLIMPALALGLSAGFVIATGINLDGGIGQRAYHPVAPTDVRDRYKLGAGELVVDLRDAKLPAGDRHVRVDVGVGHAVVLVPRNVCVTTAAKIGIGAVNAFGSESGGIDLDQVDDRTAPPGTPRVVLEGDLGVGMLDVHHAQGASGFKRGWDERHWNFEPSGNDACVGGSANAAGGSGHNG